MKKYTVAMVVCAIGLVGAGDIRAQQSETPVGGVNVAGGKRPVVPLEVQVVISKFQGEKRTSSLPYLLAVNANGSDAQLNLGVQLPVPSPTFTAGKDGEPTPVRTYSYKNVGTSINCSAVTSDDGRFEVSLQIDESSVSSTETGGVDARRDQVPVFKDFKSRNKVLLRSGQTRQYTAATDRVTGETIRIEVTLTVLK